MSTITGRCLCGAVRFRLDHPPLAVRACWCRDCQYLSSGNASVSAIFRKAGLAVTGRTRHHEGLADSGNTMRRHFCGCCGTPLFSEASDAPDHIAVRAGALDDPAIARPGSTIWTASAPPWGLIDPALPRHERQAAAVPGCGGGPQA